MKTRGRPKGSLSFTAMTLADLNSKFKADTVIPVGTVWLRNSDATLTVVGVSPTDPDPAPTVSTQPVEMTLSE